MCFLVEYHGRELYIIITQISENNDSKQDVLRKCFFIITYKELVTHNGETVALVAQLI